MQELKIKFELIKPNKIKIFDKNPLNGGIPATEKKIKTKENAPTLSNLK
jgi:hypothetical protein